MLVNPGPKFATHPNPMIRRKKNPSRSKVAGLGIGDPAKGPRLREAADRKRDVSFLFGTDYTYVDHSDFFPDWSNVEMQNEWVQVRAGIQSACWVIMPLQ
ncbi:hypothetical protein AVO44_05790 [Ruegeria profundi]|uniref:Uncharacterized protein n=1 Tax=Ruegeria profundi TaxID=1685378 RepID=A0A0X3U0H8_9RHOB|nr:hypothetical protein AVO44_05790 [Ruegeria profundi]